MKCLVRMPNWLGDCVMATPLLAALRAAYPESSITAMCRGGVAALLERDPAIDTIFRFKRHSLLSRDSSEVVESLRSGQYDVALLLPNSFSSAWLAWQAGIPRRIGYTNWARAMLLTDKVRLPRRSEHLVESYMRLLTPLGVPPSKEGTRLFVGEEERQAAAERFGVVAPAIGFNVGAAYGPAKRWLPERYREVGAALLEADPSLTLLFFGDSSMRSLIDEVTSGLSERARNLAGETSLREYMALLTLCERFVTNDSGPMHMADALGVQTVALFGSTSPERTGPYNGSRVLYADVVCSPCYRRTCPVDFRCMKRLTVDAVLESLCLKK